MTLRLLTMHSRTAPRPSTQTFLVLAVLIRSSWGIGAARGTETNYTRKLPLATKKKRKMNTVHPVTATEIKEGQHVLLKGRPCLIVAVKHCKTGKHGRAKVTLQGQDVLTSAKVDYSCAGHLRLSGFTLLKHEWQVVGCNTEEGRLDCLDAKSQPRSVDIDVKTELYTQLAATFARTAQVFAGVPSLPYLGKSFKVGAKPTATTPLSIEPSWFRTVSLSTSRCPRPSKIHLVTSVALSAHTSFLFFYFIITRKRRMFALKGVREAYARRTELCEWVAMEIYRCPADWNRSSPCGTHFPLHRSRRVPRSEAVRMEAPERTAIWHGCAPKQTSALLFGGIA